MTADSGIDGRRSSANREFDRARVVSPTRTATLTAAWFLIFMFSVAALPAEAQSDSPIIAQVSPSNVFAGKTYQIVINGIGTHFREGATRANFGRGIIVNSITVNDELTAIAQVTIDSATSGNRDVLVRTRLQGGDEELHITGGVRINQAGTAPPAAGVIAANVRPTSLVIPATANPKSKPNPSEDPPSPNLSGTQVVEPNRTQISTSNGGAPLSVLSEAAPSPRAPPENSMPEGVAAITAAGSNSGVTNESQTSSGKQAPATLPPRSPSITDFSPKSAPIGMLIKVSGNNFLNLSPVPPQVTLSQGNGSINAPVVSVNNTTIIFVIPAGATTGPIRVTVDKQTATSSQDLVILTSSTFSIAVGPTQLPIIQGQQASFSVSLSSNDGFDQLASLAVSGIPKGMTYAFSPTQITAGQTSILTLAAAPDQGLGVSPLTISATATIFGQQVVQTAMASVQVTGVSTSFIGRTAVDDYLRTPIVGVTVTFLGLDGSGHNTGCTGQTVSDESGNFSLTNLPQNCTGPQLIEYDGATATKPPGKYAGVNLVYTLVANQVTNSPVLIHLPRIDDKETVQVTQNAPNNQFFTFQSIPGLLVTVYAGTTFKLADNSTPDPFPLIAIQVPVDRLPDPMPNSGLLMPFIVAFQPANATASQPVAVTFPNTLNSHPGVSMTLMTLDPTRGFMVPYGTATVSSNGQQIVPDPDPSYPGHNYGLIHFDWHGQAPPPPPGNNPGVGGGGNGGDDGGGDDGSGDDGTGDDGTGDGGGGCYSTCPNGLTDPGLSGPPGGGSDHIDLASGLEVYKSTDIAIRGSRGSISIHRVYRAGSSNPGPFGFGTGHNYSYELSTSEYVRENKGIIWLVMPDQNQFPLNLQSDGTFTNSSIPSLVGAVLTNPQQGIYNLRWKNGTIYHFQISSLGPLAAYLNSITDPNGNTITLTLNQNQPLQITQMTDPVGRSLNLSYDGSNRITSITDPIKRTVTYSYNGQGTLASVTDPNGGITKYDYDANNNLTAITNPLGVKIAQNTYARNGRVSQQLRADGGIISFSYTPPKSRRSRCKSGPRCYDD